MGDPRDFDIPAHPDRRFEPGGELSYVGGTVFTCRPVPTAPAAAPEADPRTLVERVLAAGPYRSRSVTALPMPLWLVRDRVTGDTFRVSLRAEAVRLHVLPSTAPAALRAFFERLRSASDCEWAVERSVSEA